MNLLSDALGKAGLCDNLEGWDGVGGGREVQEEGTYVYLWLIPVDISIAETNAIF